MTASANMPQTHRFPFRPSNEKYCFYSYGFTFTGGQQEIGGKSYFITTDRSLLSLIQPENGSDQGGNSMLKDVIRSNRSPLTPSAYHPWPGRVSRRYYETRWCNIFYIRTDERGAVAAGLAV